MSTPSRRGDGRHRVDVLRGPVVDAGLHARCVHEERHTEDLVAVDVVELAHATARREPDAVVRRHDEHRVVPVMRRLQVRDERAEQPVDVAHLQEMPAAAEVGTFGGLPHALVDPGEIRAGVGDLVRATARRVQPREMRQQQVREVERRRSVRSDVRRPLGESRRLRRRQQRSVRLASLLGRDRDGHRRVLGGRSQRTALSSSRSRRSARPHRPRRGAASRGARPSARTDRGHA